MNKLLWIALVGAGAAWLVVAQSPPAKVEPVKVEPVKEDQTIVVDVTRVNVLFTVSDKRNRFVTDLKKEEFEVFEEKRQQNILEFTAESDLPLRLAVLIDTSNSIRDRFRFQQEAALEFLRSVLRPDKDRAVVIGFDTQAATVADLTADTAKLEESIRNLRPGGGTALYDAIAIACRDKLALDQPKHKFRRAMIILTDGEDNQSHYSRDQALEFAHKADVVIYAISTNITRVQQDGDKVLRYLAQETGGLVFYPFKVDDLSQHFSNIANEMRHQYNLLYRPEPLRTDGLYHTVELKVKGRKDLLVRARKGYYAPKMSGLAR